MTRRKRVGHSAVQKCDIWRRWKAGHSLHEIGRAFGKEHSSVRCLVTRHARFVPPARSASRPCKWSHVVSTGRQCPQVGEQSPWLQGQEILRVDTDIEAPRTLRLNRPSTDCYA
jgi:hypothetical protein